MFSTTHLLNPRNEDDKYSATCNYHRADTAGLLLARYLQIHHIPCVVYEREPSVTWRAQGGSLDMHEDTGLAALRVTVLLEEAQDMMRLEEE